MRTLGTLVLLMTTAAPGLAASSFEGVIEMKMSGRSGGGTMKVTVAKPGVRSEMTMAPAGQDPANGMKMTLLVKHDNKDLAYLIQDATKTYRELDLKKARDSHAKAPQTVPVIKKLPDEKVGDYACKHFVVTGAGEGEAEYWTTKQLLDWDTFVVMQQQREPGGLQKAIKDAGVEGFPVKMVRKSGSDVMMTMELVKAEKSKVPASVFDVPAGYTKEEGAPRMGGPGGGAGPLGNMPPELMEQLKKMTPEQRQQFMKQMMQGQQSPPAH